MAFFPRGRSTSHGRSLVASLPCSRGGSPLEVEDCYWGYTAGGLRRRGRERCDYLSRSIYLSIYPGYSIVLDAGYSYIKGLKRNRKKK